MIIAKLTWCIVYCCVVYIATINNGHCKVNLVYEGGEESVLGSLQVEFFHLKQIICRNKNIQPRYHGPWINRVSLKMLNYGPLNHVPKLGAVGPNSLGSV